MSRVQDRPAVTRPSMRRLRFDEALRMVPRYLLVAFVMFLAWNLITKGLPDWADVLVKTAAFGLGMPVAHMILRMTPKF